MFRMVLALLMFLAFQTVPAFSLARPDTEFKIFQFPANMIPRIDGDASDWNMVPDSYGIGADELKDTVNGNPVDKKNFDVTVKVGWVKGLDRLYFLYEAYDDYWQFDQPGLGDDIFEVVVDGDLSGGPLIPRFRNDILKEGWNGLMFHGVHAQNYHIFTPAVGKQWCMPWGCQPWIAELPWSNAAYSYHFKPGESGKLVLEFWITPFDFAPYEGPDRAVVSKLTENSLIGLSWSVLEKDKNKSDPKKNFSFWSLSHVTTMYGNASELVAFRLMPLEKQFRQPIEALWEFKTIDPARRLVAFKDRSWGNITSWKWDFGDGTTSDEQNPIHEYKVSAVEKPDDYLYQYTVNLTVSGPEGSARFARIWEVKVKE
jgi:hypothetical protein